MQDMDMDILPMDTPPLDTMARGLLMPSLRLRLMLDSTMGDMDMVLAILVLAMLDTDMDIPLMVLDTVDTTMVRSVSNILTKQKLKVITGWHIVIQCPLMRCRNCYEQIFK